MSFRDYQKKVLAAQAGKDVDWDAPADPMVLNAASVDADGADSENQPVLITSPFRQHQQSVLAQLAASPTDATGIAPAIDDSNPAANEYRVLLASLHDDIRQISDIHSHDARKPVKLQKADTYRPWVAGALAAGAQGAATQDEIVAEMLVWAIDFADYDWELEIAGHMLAHGVRMPERFPSASVAAFITAKIADAALAATDDVPHAILLQVDQLVLDCDMHDEKRALLFKALSRSFAKEADAYNAAADNAVAGGKAGLTAHALDCAKSALSLNKNAGVKKDIEQLERKLTELGGRPPVEAPAPDSDDTETTDENAVQGADATA
jgi:hypothetical protein